MENSKPKVFIASSVEGLPVAEAINANLDHSTFPTLWRAGTFRLGSNALDELVKKSSAVDFAVFVFTPDDAATIRNETSHVVRDNVLFELGLFIGALGKERCYVVRPRGIEMHLPSDLLGVITTDYESQRQDGDLESALNYACKLIKDEILQHGEIPKKTGSAAANSHRHIANPPDYILTSYDLKFLAECADSHINSPTGSGFYSICSKIGKTTPESLLRLSAIKLLRLGYIEKTVEENDYDGGAYYAFSITELGLDEYLKNETNYTTFATPNSNKSLDSGDIDDEIPF